MLRSSLNYLFCVQSVHSNLLRSTKMFTIARCLLSIMWFMLWLLLLVSSKKFINSWSLLSTGLLSPGSTVQLSTYFQVNMIFFDFSDKHYISIVKWKIFLISYVINDTKNFSFYGNSLLKKHDVWLLSSENKIGVQNFETKYRTLENSS